LVLGSVQGYGETYFLFGCRVPAGLEILGYDYSNVKGVKSFNKGYVDFGGVIVVDCGSTRYGENSQLDGLKAFKCTADTQSDFDTLTCQSPGSGCDLKNVIMFFGHGQHLSVGEAEQSCRDKGSFLSSIKTWYENSAAVWLMKQSGCTGGFIGLTDRAVENDFQWMDGSGFDIARDFSRWFYSRADSQPNDSGYLAIGEDYVIIDLSESDGFWYDVGPPRVNNPLVPGDILGYFCKIPSLQLEEELVVVEPACGWGEWGPFSFCYPGAVKQRAVRHCSCAGSAVPRSAGVLAGDGCEGSSYKERNCGGGDGYSDDSGDDYGDDSDDYGDDSDDYSDDDGDYSDDDGDYSDDSGDDYGNGSDDYDDHDDGDDYDDDGYGSDDDDDDYSDDDDDDVCEWTAWSRYSACTRFARVRRSTRHCVCPSHNGSGRPVPRSGFSASDNPCEGESYRVTPCVEEPVVVESSCAWDEFQPITGCLPVRKRLYYRRCTCDSGAVVDCDGVSTEYRDC